MGWVAVVCAAVLGAMLLIVYVGSRPWRALPDDVCQEIADIPERRTNQHLVDLELHDGRIIRKVWIAYFQFPSWPYGGRTITHRFRPKDVIHAVNGQ